MKQKTWKALLAIALVLVLTLSLVPLGAAAPGAASAAPDTTDPQTAPEAELRAQTEDVNQTAPAPAEGYIVKLRDARFADGLTCISADDGLYRAADKAQLDALPEAAVDYCEPDYKLSLLDDPAANDTLYTSGAQWNLDNLKVPAAWAKGQFGSGVTVAVLDSGLYGIAGGEHHEDIDPAKIVKPYNARRGEAVAAAAVGDRLPAAAQVVHVPEGAGNALTRGVEADLAVHVDVQRILCRADGGAERLLLVEHVQKETGNVRDLLVILRFRHGSNGLVLRLGHDLAAQVGVFDLRDVGVTVEDALRFGQEGLELVLIAECFFQIHRVVTSVFQVVF